MLCWFTTAVLPCMLTMRASCSLDSGIRVEIIDCAGPHQHSPHSPASLPTLDCAPSVVWGPVDSQELSIHHQQCPWVQVHDPQSVRGSTGSKIQAMENVSNFLEALTALDFPPVAMFSIADMEAEEGEDR